MRKNPRTNTDQIVTWCNEIIERAVAIQEEVSGDGPLPPDPEPPTGVVVTDGPGLQAALLVGGPIELALDNTFELDGAFRVPVSGTSVCGRGGNEVETTHDHAFDVPVNVDHLVFTDFSFRGVANEAFQLGVNGTSQNTVELAPDDITFARLVSEGHRGKRVFDVNAGQVLFRDCVVRDCYSPEGNDSQAICVLNGPGPVTIEGGYLEAASENVMVGGDSMKIPGCVPTTITIRGVTFSKPLAWKTAGTPKVKNLLELKTGHDVLVRDCAFSNSWASAQDGYCFMFTPKNGGSLRNVRVEDCTVRDVSAILNITGHDFTAANASELPRTQVEFHGGSYHTNKEAMGGPGRFCLITEGPERVVFNGVEAQHQGSSFLGIEDKDYVDVLHILNCQWNYGSYGVRIGGYNHGDNQLGIVGDLRIEGCTITGAHSQFKSRYPNNTYVDTMTREREREVDSHEAVAAMERDIRAELKRLKEWLA